MYNLIIRILTFFIPVSKYRKSFRKKFLREPSKIKKIKNEVINNNRLILVSSNGVETLVSEIPGLEVHFYGQNSTLKIHEPCRFENSILKLGNNNLIEIANFTMMHPMRDYSSLIIEEDFSCIGCKCNMHDEPNTKVHIGKDCQFSFDIVLWPSDGHAILDSDGKCINKGADIYIGDHVWLGMKSTVLKGAIIPSNSVVGACSLWSKAVNASADGIFFGGVYAGNPARLVKKGVTWVRENCYDYEQKLISISKNRSS